MDGKSHIKALVVGLFALSGATGLVYEIAWSKYLSLFIGNTTYSNMIVLSSFMGGLALGALYWGKYADRHRNALRLYGILECGIGIYCLAYPLIIQACESLFLSSAASLEISSGSPMLLLAKFLLSFLTLAIPTFLMGGTLPVLTKFFVHDSAETGRNVATLYFMNSLGAVAGSAAAGFFLIRFLSLDPTVWIAAGLNLLIGIVVILVSATVQERDNHAASAGPSREGTQRHYPQKLVTIAVATAALSGFIAMLYELTWIRLLANIFGSSTYSFSLMLIAFISGITLGSWLISVTIHRFGNLVKLLGVCQLGTAFFMLATLPFYERLPYYLIRLAGAIANKPEYFPILLAIEFVLCFAIMIVPTTFSGISLPIVGHIAGNNVKVLGKSIGGIFSINTLGTVLGALVTGVILIPLLGVKQSLETGILLNGLLGLVILFAGTSMQKRSKIALASLFIVVAAGYRLGYPSWNVQISIAGVFRTFGVEAPPTFEEFEHGFKERNVLWYKEGVNANVAVIEMPGDKDSTQRALVINGKADASTESDLATQILLAQIPLLVAPDSGDALVIGLGSGITCSSALRHPIHSLDCAEISSEVVECNPFFAAANNNVLADNRFHLHIEDGITFLKLNQKKYDYIISEPSNPWISGIGNLFSREFFELCKSRLTSRGLLTQWFHMYELNDDVFKLVLHTLSSAFPYVMVWTATDADVIFLASEYPIPADFDAIQHRLTQPEIAKELAKIDIADVPTLLTIQSTAFLSPTLFNGEDAINTEKKPLLEFMAPVSLFAASSLAFPATIDDRFSSQAKDLWFTRYERTHPLRVNDFLAIARYQSRRPTDYRLAFSAYTKCLLLEPGNIEALGGITRATDALNIPDERRAALRTLALYYRDDPTILSQLATEIYKQEMQSASMTNPPAMTDPIRLFTRCVELTKREDERYFLTLALALNSAGRFSEAAEAYKQVREIRLRFEPSAAEITDEDLQCSIAENYYFADRLNDAAPLLEEVRKTSPGNEKMRRLMEKIMLRRKGAL